MTLHPQAAAHLTAAAAAAPIHTLDVAAARLAGLGFIQLQRPIRDVAQVVHRFIPGPTADLPVRIYRPAHTTPDSPAVLMLHGSGWVTCNLDVCDEPARVLADDTGFVVVTVNYQKAPEHPYPAPLDDCEAAFDWLVTHAAELGIDASRIGVVGDSAGGNLAAALCLRRRDHGRALPAAQALLYPALAARYDPARYPATDDGALSILDMAWFFGHYLAGQEPNAYAAPLLATDVAGLPETLLVTAEHDVLRGDGTSFAKRLSAAGVPVTHADYGGAIHGFYWMDAVLDDTQLLQHELATWLIARLQRIDEGDDGARDQG